VDKTGFVYRLKGLRAPGWAGKALYRACTDVGQKPGEQKIRRFAHPVLWICSGFSTDVCKNSGFLVSAVSSAAMTVWRTGPSFLVLQLTDLFFL
jgi:hypothetical protein